MTIPGDILEDERVSDGAKIIYGKIARLSYKTGYCWATNKFLDGTETGRSASRQIQELINAGYIAVTGQGKNRKLYICEVDSKVGHIAIRPVDPPTPEMAKNTMPTSPKVVSNLAKNCTNLAKSGEPTSPKVATEHLNKQIKEQEKETEEDVSFPDDKPIEKREDAATVFQKARLFWNEKGLKPECRDIMMRCSDREGILRTMQHYAWEEIRNAIGNYHWHKTGAGPEFEDPPLYGSLAGFLKTGVERYFDDDALDQQFKKRAKN